jgi:hypothetical protein
MLLIFLTATFSFSITLNTVLFRPNCTFFQIIPLCFLFLILTVNVAESSQQDLCHNLNAFLSWNFLHQIN